MADSSHRSRGGDQYPEQPQGEPGKKALNALADKLSRRRDGSQPKPRQPGPNALPKQLREGVEALAGMAMDDVTVHRNSLKPAALGALAYAQGSEIHLGPGQDAHLPHEAWHVAQQKQGRVKPTLQAKGVPINDEAGLEAEADREGLRALRIAGRAAPQASSLAVGSPKRSPVQALRFAAPNHQLKHYGFGATPSFKARHIVPNNQTASHTAKWQLRPENEPANSTATESDWAACVKADTTQLKSGTKGYKVDATAYRTTQNAGAAAAAGAAGGNFIVTPNVACKLHVTTTINGYSGTATATHVSSK